MSELDVERLHHLKELEDKDGWIADPRKNPPPEGELVEVKGSDWGGGWTGKAVRKDYKPGSTKGQLRRKWRWMQGGYPMDDVPEAWRFIRS